MSSNPSYQNLSTTTAEVAKLRLGTNVVCLADEPITSCQPAGDVNAPSIAPCAKAADISDAAIDTGLAPTCLRASSMTFPPIARIFLFFKSSALITLSLRITKESSAVRAKPSIFIPFGST